MHRNKLLSHLIQYQPTSKGEQTVLNQITTFVAQNPQCFHRELAKGHVTGSAWLVNHSHNAILLTHHRKLDKWCQLGGHCDGDPDIVEVALREAIEESGISSIQLASTRIFDLDIHKIPENNQDAEHLHYDIRFMFKLTEPADFVLSAESKELRWVTFQESQHLDLDESVRRMFNKWFHRKYYHAR